MDKRVNSAYAYRYINLNKKTFEHLTDFNKLESQKVIYFEKSLLTCVCQKIR